VIENYQGEEANAIIAEAKSKIARIQTESLQKSKIETRPVSPDSIQLAPDPTIKKRP
jgi:hypothetical protein